MTFRNLLPGPALTGQPLVHGYLTTWLGKRTYGRVLNVGAGAASVQYDYAHRLANDEYHTLEISNETSPTYVGNVCAMPQVPSDSYDWVMAVAVLEHVKDMWAGVREITRVVKPGGRVYISIPFHNDIHFEATWGDYWRVSPFGFRELLEPTFSIESIEYWGDTMCDPVAIGVIARKNAPAERQEQHLFYIDGGFDTINHLIDGKNPFLWSMPVYRLRLDGIEYVRQVRGWRVAQFTNTGAALSINEADRLLFPQASVLEGHIVITNDDAEFRPAG